MPKAEKALGLHFRSVFGTMKPCFLCTSPLTGLQADRAGIKKKMEMVVDCTEWQPFFCAK
jgi:hypothetical protein